MTDDQHDDGQANLSRQTETNLRVVALYAVTLADALLLARRQNSTVLTRITRGWLLHTRSATVAIERQLHVSIFRLDPRLALTVRDVASVIRARNPDDP